MSGLAIRMAGGGRDRGSGDRKGRGPSRTHILDFLGRVGELKLPGNPWTSSLIYKSRLPEAAVNMCLRAETVQRAAAGQPP